MSVQQMTTQEACRTVGMATVFVVCGVTGEGFLSAWVELRNENVEILLAHRWRRSGDSKVLRQMVLDVVDEASVHDAVAMKPNMLQAIAECAEEVMG